MLLSRGHPAADTPCGHKARKESDAAVTFLSLAPEYAHHRGLGSPVRPDLAPATPALPSSGLAWYYSLLELDFVSCSERRKLSKTNHLPSRW